MYNDRIETRGGSGAGGEHRGVNRTGNRAGAEHPRRERGGLGAPAAEIAAEMGRVLSTGGGC
jgi:hypothetical protein